MDTFKYIIIIIIFVMNYFFNKIVVIYMVKLWKLGRCTDMALYSRDLVFGTRIFNTLLRLSFNFFPNSSANLNIYTVLNAFFSKRQLTCFPDTKPFDEAY